MVKATGQVQELQGLYGPFTLAERVVQKIWLRRDFDTTAARLLDGRPCRIHRPGCWNLLAGPDFRGARLAFADREVTGDVEVHLHESDWRSHGHGDDPTYDRVVLHVVLFPPAGAATVARSRRGEPLPTLVLLPLLHRGLEEYASDDALETLTARDAAEKLAGLSMLAPTVLRDRLRSRADERWKQKVDFARLRLRKLGWTGAAHHAALEILGYRHNRAAMLSLATRYPLSRWCERFVAERAFHEQTGAWQTQGVRPANHPLRRLRQYGRWVEQVPDWPERLHAVFASVADGAECGAGTRRELRLSVLRARVATLLTGGAVGGSRLDNLVCDGLLPLLAAATSRDFSQAWFHWYVGDIPGEVRRGVVALGLAGGHAGPQCHGWAQGLLAWMLERDGRANG